MHAITRKPYARVNQGRALPMRITRIAGEQIQEASGIAQPWRVHHVRAMLVCTKLV